MAVYKLEGNQLHNLEPTSFEIEKIMERKHIQSVLRSNVGVVAPDVLVIAEEFGEWEESKRRIDLLGVDKDGGIVVIEIKRTESGGLMELQAVRYAAMVSTMTFNQAVSAFGQYLQSLKDNRNAQEELLRFLEWDEPHPDQFALNVKIILVSADFSKELTTSVLWLNQQGLDIRCVRLKPYRSDGSVILDVQQVIPLPETEEFLVKVREQQEQRREAVSLGKDYTKYWFEGELHPKNRLVLAVVKAYLRDRPGTTFEQLKQAFPDDLQGAYGVVNLAQTAQEISKTSGHKRYFIDPTEILTTADGVKAAVCTQWGKRKTDRFLKRAKELEFQIEAEQI